MRANRAERAIEALVAELLSGSAVGLFERGAAQASDEPDGAVHAFLALALVDLGRYREAVSLNLTALSRYLPRYNRSLARYAQEISGEAFIHHECR
jgi:hypothetical protein